MRATSQREALASCSAFLRAEQRNRNAIDIFIRWVELSPLTTKSAGKVKKAQVGSCKE
jgi:hypothetical protein